jgi:hypothetical protein
MSCDFTLDKYAELCHVISQFPCNVMTIAEFIEAGQPQRHLLILRHDIDRASHTALRMAQLETKFSIKSTYYVRMTPAVFSPDLLLSLQNLGHDVGYHYETLAKTKGNSEQALLLFEKELDRFRKILPVKTVSMHGSPLSSWKTI